jgi:hypothetical protein
MGNLPGLFQGRTKGLLPGHPIPPVAPRLCPQIAADFLIPDPDPFLSLRRADFFLILILNP